MRKVMPFVLFAMMACGGGASSPTSAPTPVPAPTPMKDGVLVVGTMEATFILTGQMCGDFSMKLPYRETAGGNATVHDYDFRLLDSNGTQLSRVVGDFNGAVAPLESRTFTWTPFNCPHFSGAGPWFEILVNYSVPSGRAFQLNATGFVVSK